MMEKTKVMVLKSCKKRPDLWAKCFLSYPFSNLNLCSIGSTFTLKCPTRSHMGGKHKFICFYPKIIAYCIGLDACRFLKCNILLHVRVTHEDVWRQMLKSETNFTKLPSIRCFTPKLSTQRGPFVYNNVYNFKYF